MTEYGDMCAEMRDHKRTRKQAALAVFETVKVDLVAMGLVQRSEVHWTITIHDQVCQFWPTTDKWQYGKTYNGTAVDFRNWLRRTLKIQCRGEKDPNDDPAYQYSQD